MLARTHLAFAFFVVLLFVNHVENKIVFVAVALFATLIPDVDTYFSWIGSGKLARPVQFFSKHRGFIHSLTFAVLFSIILAIFLPVIAFAFFLGYSVHVFIDSFTKQGIQPFWPISKKSSGYIRTGNIEELFVFIFFAVIDLVLLFVLFFNV
jgi:inner membrane protein